MIPGYVRAGSGVGARADGDRHPRDSGGITVPAYAAAKHGVLGLGRALSNEWAGKGINVNR